MINKETIKELLVLKAVNELQRRYFENTGYMVGIDPYSTEPKNFYHKVRKFFGLNFKEKQQTNSIAVFKKYEDGTIKRI